MTMLKYYLAVSSHEPLKNYVEHQIVSSERDDYPPDFAGEGSIRIKLLDDPIVSQRFIEISLSSQIVLSGIKFEMPDTKALKKFTLTVEEAGIAYPDKFTHWGVITLDIISIKMREN